MSFDIQIANPTGVFGLGNHDIVIDSTGSTIKLQGQDKLIQDVQKILFTNVNNFYKEYGTKLEELIGTNLGIQETVNILAQRIGDSLAYLITLQQAQVKYQQCQSSELIENILELNVDYKYELTQLDQDATTFQVTIKLESADNQIVTVSKEVTAV